MTTWTQMNDATRHAASLVTRSDIPRQPGVYAWYRDGIPVYVGKATGREGLRQRAWSNHMARGRGAMSGSAFRRNVAEYLGFAAAGAIKTNTSILSDAEVSEVNSWIRDCHLAWVETSTAASAVALESALKAERLPLLTKR